MKCLFVVPYPGFFSQHNNVGGHAAHVSGMVEGLMAEGVEVDVLADERSTWLGDLGVRELVYPSGKKGVASRIQWSHSLPGAVKRLVKQAGYDFVYMRYSAGFAPWIPAVGSAAGDATFILEVNSLGSQWQRFMRPLDRRALRAADSVIVISGTLKTWINDSFGERLQGVTFSVVPNAISVRRFSRVEQAPSAGDPVYRTVLAHKHAGRFIYGYLGVLKPNYGIETLIHAHTKIRQSIPDALLVIVGDGPHFSALQRLVRDDDTILIPGSTNPRAIPSVLHLFDTLIYTTNHQYTFQSPVKMYEYMATGVPVVAAETRQTQELLGKDSERGYLFSIGSSEALASKVVRAKTDGLDAKKRANRARTFVFSSNTWQHRARQVISMIPNASNSD